MRARNIVNSFDTSHLKKNADSLDFVLSTVNVDLGWSTFLASLDPMKRFHSVGVIPSPIPTEVLLLIAGQKSISSSPLGLPAGIRKKLDFCARHCIEPITEHLPMSQANESMAHLEASNARYRIVLDNDLV